MLRQIVAGRWQDAKPAEDRRPPIRCRRVEFVGFKRLLHAKANLDDRLIAFVGPNEAGKSSVLDGLAWLEGADAGALPPSLASRGQSPAQRADDDAIVTTYFRLDHSDWTALEHLDYATLSSKPTYRVWRSRAGELFHRLDPPLLRNPEPFDRARAAIGRAPRVIADALQAADEDRDPSGSDECSPERELHDACTELLNTPEVKASTEQVAQLRQFSTWLEVVAQETATPTLGQAALAVSQVAEAFAAGSPNEAALAILDQRRPRFRAFKRADRNLESDVDITDEDRELSLPLRRLLVIARTNEENLRRIWGDEGARDTHLAECNRNLDAFFADAWTQSELSVQIKAEQHLLKVQVKVVENGRTYYSTFGERSDGLKSFVALVGFLQFHRDQRPPILLIDEAETHLHLDAQADLIDVLQQRVAATQIFYTTHSPGCLPMDLGRGLRFVEPSDDHYSSTLSHNFWDSKHPGFSAVLFKMGASAYAFSTLRKAVLAEGASDMILLPRLIRTATGLDALPYQVAPRMADFDESKVGRHEVAASAVYLVDGDGGGRDRSKNLRRTYRVSPHLVLSHPRGYAVEDYLEPAMVLAAVNEVRADSKQHLPVRLSELPGGETLGQRIDRWFVSKRITAPSKVAVATYLVNEDELRLRSGARTRLQKLHAGIGAALARRPD